MCFSATASFVTAAAAGAAGIWCLSRAPSPRYWLLAAVPIILAGQQAIEAVIWLALNETSPSGAMDGLASAFLFVGQALWPLVIPLAVLLVEPPGWRQPVLALMALGGLFLTALFSALIAAADYEAVVEDGCLRYPGCVEVSSVWNMYPIGRTEAWSLGGLDWTVLPYAIVVIGALLISSAPRVRWFGYLTGLGLAVSLVLHRNALVSVWCFFAAAGSLVLVAAIEAARQEGRARQSV